MELLEEKILLNTSAARTEAQQRRDFPQIAKAYLLMRLTATQPF